MPSLSSLANKVPAQKISTLIKNAGTQRQVAKLAKRIEGALLPKTEPVPNAGPKADQPAGATMRQFSSLNRVSDAAQCGASTKAFSPKAPALAHPSAAPAASTNGVQGTGESANYNAQPIALMMGGAVIGTLALHSMIGSEDNYYEYRFTTDKDPDDLAGFYGSEEFMDLFCVVPFVGTLMMRGGEFDDEGGFHTTGIPGKLAVNMVFSDAQDPETGQTQWFNKRERFKDTFCGRTMWDTVMNFGFRKLPNGKTECYHAGEYFKGSAPPISLVIKLMFQVHARWVAWATEHHLNQHAFTSTSASEEATEVCSRKDMPLHLLKDHLLTDVKAMLLGEQAEPATPDSTGKSPNEKNTEATSEPIKFVISQTQPDDKRSSTAPSEDTSRSEPDALTDKQHTKTQPSFLVRPRSENAGSVVYDLPISEQLPMQKIKSDIETDKKAQQAVELQEDDFGYRNLGGNQAWELLRATNNPAVYQKVTQAALQRHQTRRTLDRSDTEADGRTKGSEANTKRA